MNGSWKSRLKRRKIQKRLEEKEKLKKFELSLRQVNMIRSDDYVKMMSQGMCDELYD